MCICYILKNNYKVVPVFTAAGKVIEGKLFCFAFFYLNGVGMSSPPACGVVLVTDNVSGWLWRRSRNRSSSWRCLVNNLGTTTGYFGIIHSAVETNGCIITCYLCVCYNCTCCNVQIAVVCFYYKILNIGIDAYRRLFCAFRNLNFSCIYHGNNIGGTLYYHCCHVRLIIAANVEYALLLAVYIQLSKLGVL